MSYSATDFYNQELDRLKSKQSNANDILNSQKRLADLNDSYRKRYSKYVQILMVLLSAFAIYLATITLQVKFPVIPQIAVDVVTIVLIFLVTLYLFTATWELYSRSLLNYDELDIPAYDASGIDIDKLKSEGQLFGSLGYNMCIGQDCCPEGFIYDQSTNRCVEDPNPTPTPSRSSNPSATTSTSATTKSPFTTIETAYSNVPFDSNSLKREPNAQNVKPLQDVSVLIYSNY